MGAAPSSGFLPGSSPRSGAPLFFSDGRAGCSKPSIQLETRVSESSIPPGAKHRERERRRELGRSRAGGEKNVLERGPSLRVHEGERVRRLWNFMQAATWL